MSDDDYPELDKTLIEITEETIDEDEDIFPLIDYEDVEREKHDRGEDLMEKIYKHVRLKIISIIRSKISYEN
tara:strand:- start:1608 stop:1823 length:216 start_codon:yes stop_codon:yes gene_type:complete